MTGSSSFEGLDKSPELIFKLSVEDAAALVQVVGEIDMESAPMFERQLARQITGDVRVLVVDLSEVSFLASSGLNSLLVVHEICRAGDVSLKLVVGQNRRVLRILSITGLDTFFGLHKARHDAVTGREEVLEE